MRRFTTTTNSTHALPVAANVLAQTFAARRPNETWVTDITYVPTADGWLYLAGIKDLFTCEVVGHAMGARMTTELIIQALEMAVWAKRPRPGLIHHADRGSQYCAQDYQDQVRQCGMTASMSRRGNRYDTREQARREISEYIEIFRQEDPIYGNNHIPYQRWEGRRRDRRGRRVDRVSTPRPRVRRPRSIR